VVAGAAVGGTVIVVVDDEVVTGSGGGGAGASVAGGVGAGVGMTTCWTADALAALDGFSPDWWLTPAATPVANTTVASAPTSPGFPRHRLVLLSVVPVATGSMGLTVWHGGR
jgi:hypothetical protein